MKILFVNDDGYDSIGINTLYREFTPHYECRMCAPLLHKSAFSHAINFKGNLEVVTLDGGIKGFALDGTPADCSKAGLGYLFRNEAPFDVVLSGINFGVNIGKDTIYSGTVGAAREAMLLGTYGVAFSQQVSEDSDWDAAPYFNLSSRLSRQIFDALPKELNSFKNELIVNINFPQSLEIKGIKMSTLGNQTYDFHTQSLEIEGTRYITFKETRANWPDEPGTDCYWLKRGYITASALYKGFDIHPKGQKILSSLENLKLQ